MSHKLWICVPKNIDNIDHICAKIVGMGVTISALAKSGNLYEDSKDSSTSIIAINVHNFNRELGSKKIIDIIKSNINNYSYYGIILYDVFQGSSTWDTGNVNDDVKPKDLIEPIKKIIENTEIEKKELEKKTEDIKIDMSLLLSVLKSSTVISDVFFENTQCARKELYEKIEMMVSSNSDSKLKSVLSKYFDELS